jgi:hypothetical protein
MTPTILSYEQASRAVAAGLRSRVAVLLEGPPGVGKTSLVRAAGRTLDLPVYDLIGANLDPTDVAGLPYRTDAGVQRALYPEIAACVARPGILFLDELTTAPPSVRAALLRVLLERNAGGQPLHEQSRVIAACNAPEHAPNAVPLDAASLNRVSRLAYAPTAAEIAAYFAAVTDPDWSIEAHDFAATLAADPTLVTIDPPAASVDGGEPWGSPRGWELGLRIWSADGAQTDECGRAILAGCVGERAAIALLAIRRLRAHLPTAAEIATDPTGARLPDQADHQIAALGLLARVVREESGAAWVYAARLKPELGAAAAKVLIHAGKAGKRWAKEGAAAQIGIMARAHQGTR